MNEDWSTKKSAFRGYRACFWAYIGRAGSRGLPGQFGHFVYFSFEQASTYNTGAPWNSECPGVSTDKNNIGFGAQGHGQKYRNHRIGVWGSPMSKSRSY